MKEISEQERMILQDQITQKGISTQTIKYAPETLSNQQANQAVLVAQTDPSKIVKEIILILQGYEKNGDKYVLVHEPKLNKVGIEKLSFWLHGFLNDGGRLTHLEKEEISNIMKELGEDLPLELGMYWRLWGITNPADKDTINNIILSNIFFLLKRSQEQNEKNWLGKATVEQISHTTPRQKSNSGEVLKKFRL
jgi:hypothetical protein